MTRDPRLRRSYNAAYIAYVRIHPGRDVRGKSLYTRWFPDGMSRIHNDRYITTRASLLRVRADCTCDRPIDQSIVHRYRSSRASSCGRRIGERARTPGVVADDDEQSGRCSAELVSSLRFLRSIALETLNINELPQKCVPPFHLI